VTCQYSLTHPWVLSTWVKSPILNTDRLVIVSACLPYINRELFEKLSNEGTVIFACPEREPAMHYGKIASIIRSSGPKEVWVVTVDGSPHCLALQAALNEAEYILGERLNKRHFVLVDGGELVEVDPDAVRVARYISIVNELLRRNRDFVINELSKHSLEFRRAHGIKT